MCVHIYVCVICIYIYVYVYVYIYVYIYIYTYIWCSMHRFQSLLLPQPLQKKETWSLRPQIDWFKNMFF